jgi:outer membrane murein-binding lipoprotein Lpp
MRKTIGIVLAFSLVFAVSLAYACGEKRSSADATKAGAELTTLSKQSCAYKANVTAAVSEGNKANARIPKASIVPAIKTGKASVKNADAKGQYCPASPSCPTPCVKQTGEAQIKKSSVSTDSEADLDKIASTSDKVAPEANPLK